MEVFYTLLPASCKFLVILVIISVGRIDFAQKSFIMNLSIYDNYIRRK